MKKHTAGMTALLLTFGLILAGCDLGGGGSDGDGGGTPPAFVAVTGINDVPTAALVGDQLPLSGTVAPSNATNKTIVWSGNNVSNSTLNAAAAGDYEVTATIANGATRTTPYTRKFTIKVYNAGTSTLNPFGEDASPTASPYVWVMDGTQSQAYATVKDSTWEAEDEWGFYNSGTYFRIPGTKAAQWTVATGGYAGDTGLALILDNGKLLAANFTHENSTINGMFTKLDRSLTLQGTWQTDERVPPWDDYVKVVAGANGEFIESASSDKSSWTEKVKGTYTTTAPTNPATLTVTHAKINTNWESWATLPQDQKNDFGGSDTYKVFIYADRCEAAGFVFLKQP
ncbi:MAG: hypothetical protein LBG57_08410 [Treponema sp.]|nr:hypothetical protein [Treponema sp.]